MMGGGCSAAAFCGFGGRTHQWKVFPCDSAREKHGEGFYTRRVFFRVL